MHVYAKSVLNCKFAVDSPIGSLGTMESTLNHIGICQRKIGGKPLMN